MHLILGILLALFLVGCMNNREHEGCCLAGCGTMAVIVLVVLVVIGRAVIGCGR